MIQLNSHRLCSKVIIILHVCSPNPIKAKLFRPTGPLKCQLRTSVQILLYIVYQHWQQFGAPTISIHKNVLELHQLIISCEAPSINNTGFMNCDLLSLAFQSLPPKAVGDVELHGQSVLHQFKSLTITSRTVCLQQQLEFKMCLIITV